MAEIPWWAWIGVGLFVSVSSAYMGGKVSWFAWVGLLFIAFGIAKVVYLFVMRPRESKKEQQVILPVYHVPHSICPRCRITVQPTDFFCKYCGWKLR